MAYEFIRVRCDGPVTVVTIDRPESRNALHRAAHDELADAFDRFAADEAQWVAIVTGAGDKAFCAGQDLKSPIPTSSDSLPRSGFGGLTSRFDLDKPIIAAVNGAAFGGGFELALACDIIVASSKSVFALPEPRVGLAALAGGMQRLPQEIGLKRALRYLLTGDRIPAAEAFAAGFVAEVCEGDVLACAWRWAERLTACAPLAVRATKRAALDAVGKQLDGTIPGVWSLPVVASLLGSADAREGQTAFREKRAPVWAGR